MSLQACDLALTRGTRPLFSELSFTLNRGQSIRILGENGAGKTSLLRVLCGLSVPDQGKVLWRGDDIKKRRAEFAACVTYIGHAEAVKPDLLAWENLAFGALAGHPDAREVALSILESEGLGDQAILPARVLSQGQRRRLSLTRLRFAALGSLLVLDEPFCHLDQAATARVTGQLISHCLGGGMLVYASHGDETLAGAATLALRPDEKCVC